MELRDLSPRKDPKGGSPKTPMPLSRRVINGINGYGMWKTASSSLGGLVVGLIVAWFTAYSGKGVTQKEMEDYVKQYDVLIQQHVMDSIPKYLTRSEMEDYVKNYSPYMLDRTYILNSQRSQDQTIGDLRSKIDMVAKYMEEQQANRMKR